MKCFACDKEMKSRPYPVDTRDGQVVLVGPECFKHIKKAKDQGYQPSKGGPKLYWPILAENVRAGQYNTCLKNFAANGGVW